MSDTYKISGPKPDDPYWCRVVLRPAAAPFVIAAARLNVSPNQISVAGTLVAFIAGIAIATGNLAVAFLGAVVFNVIALLDCVDGALARHTGNTGPNGSWFDAQTGYTVYAVLPLAVAWRGAGLVDDTNSAISGELLLLAGSMTAVLNLYSRVLYQKYLLTAQAAGKDVTETASSQKQSLKNRLLAELGMVGFMMPALLISVLLGFETVFVLFYFFVYASVGLVGALVLMQRVVVLSNQKSN